MMIKLIIFFTLVTLVKWSHGRFEYDYQFLDQYKKVTAQSKQQIKALQSNFINGYQNAGIERIARIRKEHWQLWLRLNQVGKLEVFPEIKNRHLNIGTMSLECSNWFEFENAQVQLNNLPKKQVLCQYNRPNNPQYCNMAYNPVVRDKPAKTSDLKELKHYWLEFRNKLGPIGKQAVLDYVKQYKESARVQSTNPFLSLENHALNQYYHRFYDFGMLEKFEAIILQLMPLYKEFHAYIRNSLLVYGKDVIDRGDTIPQNLFEHFLTKAWTEDHSLRIYMPYPDVPFPVVRNNYQVKSIYDLSQGLFKKFINDNSLLKTNFVPLNTNLDDPFCKNEIYDMSLEKKHVEIRHCPSVNFRTFLQTYGESYLTPYTIDMSIDDLAMFDDLPCPGFSLAMSKVFSLHASSPSFIKSVDYLDDWKFEDEPRKINRLFLMGLQSLFKLFSAFVHEKLFVSMLISNSENFNCEYWNLMEKYMGVRPPQKRNNSDFDVPIQFYEGVNPRKPFTAKLVSEIFGHQLYRGICKKLNLPLSDCNFEKSENAGTVLDDIRRTVPQTCQSYFLHTIQEENITADSMLEFFKPIYEWLKKTNKQKKARIGFQLAEDSCS